MEEKIYFGYNSVTLSISERSQGELKADWPAIPHSFASDQGACITAKRIQQTA